MGNKWKQWQTIFLDSKITVAGDCSHEIKRCLPLGRKAMINLDNILKSRDISWPTKVHRVKTMVFPAVMYGCKKWIIKKAEHQRTDAFKLWCWRRLWRVSGSMEIKPIDLKGNQPWLFIGRTDAEAKAPILWPFDGKSWLTGKKSWCWERLRAGERADWVWDGRMASLTQWTWVWANSRR